MRTYIITANYLNLHKIFLYFENKYGQTGKTVSKTDRVDIRATIKELQLSIPPRDHQLNVLELDSSVKNYLLESIFSIGGIFLVNYLTYYQGRSNGLATR